MHVAVAVALFLALATPLRAQVMTDQEFVNATAGTAMLLTEMGQTVLDRTPNDAVTEVATETIAAHRTNAIILKSIVEGHDLEMPTSLDETYNATLSGVADAPEEELAAVYADEQVKAHERAIATAERYIAESKDEELKRYAEDSLFQLERGLKEAQALRETLK